MPMIVRRPSLLPSILCAAAVVASPASMAADETRGARQEKPEREEVKASTTAGFLAPAPATTQPGAVLGAVARPRLAVAGFTAPGLSSEVVATLENACAAEVSRLVNADVISAEDLRMLLNVSAYQATLGCESGDCLRSLADAVAVQQVVSGTVRKTAAGFALNLARIDTVNARVLERATVEASDVAGLAKAVRQATPALFGVIGKVEVWGQPEGAELFLDGALVGVTPLSVVDVRSPGKHTIDIIGPTVTPWHADIEIGAGDDMKLRAKNRPIVDVEADAAAWTVAGLSFLTTGVLAAAGAGTTWFLALRNDQRLDDKTLRTATQQELNAITDVSLGYMVATGALASVALVGIGGGSLALLLNPPRAELEEALR